VRAENVRPRTGGSAPGPNGKGPNGGGPGGDWEDRKDGWSPDRYRIGVLVAIASILMMFTALTSAYIVRAGLPGSYDWRPLAVPPYVWLSTALILLSSLTVRNAQRAQRKSDEAGYGRWLWASLLLGLGFVASQLLAWRQLVAEGLYLASNPHGSFFYVLTGLHALHVLGGIAALCYLVVAARRKVRTAAVEVRQRTYTDVVALYWHFMDGLWVFLFLLLFLWR
jgi:cytochrome c oxidase subunit 3